MTKDVPPLLVNLRSNSKDALICRICKKCFNTGTELKVHCVLHTLEDTFQCSECARSFSKEHDLKKHLKNSHAPRNILQCNICKDTFEDSSSHQQHMEGTHTKNLRSRNPVIKRKQKKIPALPVSPKKKITKEIHYRTTKNSGKSMKDVMPRPVKKNCRSFKKRPPIGKSRFICPFLHCQKKCLNNSQWIIHLTTHSTDRPLVCTVCGKGFKLKASFDGHMKVHDKTRPKYKCHLCREEFLWPTSFRKHLTNSHKIKDPSRFENEALYHPETL